MTAETAHTRTRDEIPETDKWDLTHLFADVGKWHEDFTWMEHTYPAIAQWKNRVGESPQTLADVLEFEKQLDQKIERLYHYASLQQAEDSANPEYLARIATTAEPAHESQRSFSVCYAGDSGDRR